MSNSEHIVTASSARIYRDPAIGWRAAALPPDFPQRRPQLAHILSPDDAEAQAGFRSVAYHVVFPTKEAKALWMQHGAERDSTHPMVTRWARVFAHFPRPERERHILHFCQFGIEYVRDPKFEVLDSAPVCLWRGYGDCDAKARLFVALCLACHVPAKIDPVYRGDSFPHVRARVEEPEGWESAGDAGWLVTDPTILNSDIGNLPPHPFTNIAHGVMFLTR